MAAVIGILARDARAIEASTSGKPADATLWRGKHFVWRVSNAPAPFYLMGSMHALRGSEYPLSGVIDRAIADSQKIILETDPEARDAPFLRRRLLLAGQYPHGVTLDQKVSPETFALLKRIARVRLSEYAHHKPWAIAFFTLWQPPEVARRESHRRVHRFARKPIMDRSARLSVDRYVYNKTRGRKQIAGLETVDEFVQGFSNMSDADSESYLLEIIGYARGFPELFSDTIAAWKSGDTQRMYRLYPPRTRNNGYWRWVESRNRVWVSRIDAAIKSGTPTTVVAGAFHFCGPHSLIALLQKRGYQIEQL